MRTSAARALHLTLIGLGLLLYVVFVLPRWWVLTGDIPRTLAVAGRIAAGIPIGLAALPVMQLLKAGLGTTPRPPEIALRLRAWSGLLYVVAGALILLAAIAEIWVGLQAAGPWLFGVYGAAGAMAILAVLGVYLSFVAEKSPASPKPAKVKKVRADAGKKPTTKRGRKTGKTAGTAAEPVDADSANAETVDTHVHQTAGDSDNADPVTITTDAGETAPDTEAVIVTEADSAGDATEAVTIETAPTAGGLRNKRPAGKSRRRLSR